MRCLFHPDFIMVMRQWGFYASFKTQHSVLLEKLTNKKRNKNVGKHSHQLWFELCFKSYEHVLTCWPAWTCPDRTSFFQILIVRRVNLTAPRLKDTQQVGQSKKNKVHFIWFNRWNLFESEKNIDLTLWPLTLSSHRFQSSTFLYGIYFISMVDFHQ